jgi:hypothetical protein
MKAIIVLGSRIPGNNIHEELKMRLDTAINLFDKNSILILSGGFTNHKHKSEAGFMEEYCIGKGIPQDRIVLEEESLDTIGNGYFTRLTVDQIPSVNMVTVVTSCYHMERSEFIFRACFGNKYLLDFSNCCDFPRATTLENDSMQMAKAFFHGIGPGDISAVREKLYVEHLLYKEE